VTQWAGKIPVTAEQSRSIQRFAFGAECLMFRVLLDPPRVVTEALHDTHDVARSAHFIASVVQGKHFVGHGNDDIRVLVDTKLVKCFHLVICQVSYCHN
jgi:hypothetical protein